MTINNDNNAADLFIVIAPCNYCCWME